jgi:hypothetical protein
MGKLKQWRVISGEIVREFDASALHSYNNGLGPTPATN